MTRAYQVQKKQFSLVLAFRFLADTDDQRKGYSQSNFGDEYRRRICNGGNIRKGIHRFFRTTAQNLITETQRQSIIDVPGYAHKERAISNKVLHLQLQ